MKKYLLGLLVTVSLCACSEESKVKSAALGGAKERFHSEMKEQISKGVNGKTNLQNTAANILTEKSEFEVQKMDISGNHADVVVQVLTVPPKAREALIDIMEKLDEKKERSFNVPDALRMIQQQMQLSDTKALMVYKMSLDKGESWKVNEPAGK